MNQDRPNIAETDVQTNDQTDKCLSCCRSCLSWFDTAYFKTKPGALKVIAIILDLIVYICAMASGKCWRQTTEVEFCAFVSIAGFFVSGILLILYLLHVVEKLQVIPWILSEMIFCAIWTIFYLAAGIACAANTSLTCNIAGTVYGHSAIGAMAFFSFVAFIVYGCDVFLKFRGWRAS